jgi:cell volume regulation protein A
MATGNPAIASYVLILGARLPAAVEEILDYAVIVSIASAGLLGAVVVSKLGPVAPIPGPAIFLVVAAAASAAHSGLHAVSIEDASRIGVVALIVILFEGGMHVGWRRFQRSAAEISVLGVLGTFGTAFVVAVFAHWALGFSWTLAAVIGAAVAPTDPAVMFSVLGKREIGGRSGTILEGESGFNDPVGISLMIGALVFATHDDASFWPVAGEFASEMLLGLAFGVAGGIVLGKTMRRIDLPSQPLYPIFALAFAGTLYGLTTIAHGSGFLAVFAAGVLFGDQRAPHKGEVERFHKSLASLSEIAVFAVFGITISLRAIVSDGVWLDGLLLALVLALVARPLVAGLIVLPARLHWGERIFVMWGGLKGAVPILLGTLAVIEGVEGAGRVYGLIFVVVTFSVLVQGTSIPFVAPRLGVPMRPTGTEGIFSCTVAPGSRAERRAVKDLPISDRAWIRELIRSGRPLAVTGDTVLEAGDELQLLTDVDDIGDIRRLLTGARP